jgi:hypothetical protein
MAGYTDTLGGDSEFIKPASSLKFDNDAQRRQYERDLKAATTRADMSYGQLPQEPNESWNAWKQRQSDFENSFDPKNSYDRNAMDKYLGVDSSSKKTVRSTSRSGGGGGGGMIMPQQQAKAPTPVEFYRGPSPTLQGLTMDYGELGKRVMEVNKPFAEQFRQFNPMAEAGTRALSQAGATSAAGQIDRETMGELGRTNAFLGFGTGLGARSGAGRARIARDVGLSVAQAQQQGANLLAQATGLTQQAMAAMMPVSATEIFTTAANQASINNQIANQNLLNAWQSQILPGEFDIQKGQFASFTPGQYSATRPLLPGTTFLEKPKSQGMASGNWLEREDARNKQIDAQNAALREAASNWAGNYKPQFQAP